MTSLTKISAHCDIGESGRIRFRGYLAGCCSDDPVGVVYVGTMWVRRMLGYRWHDCMSNDLVLREPGLRQVTCIVRERRLRLYGHVAQGPAENPQRNGALSPIRINNATATGLK